MTQELFIDMFYAAPELWYILVSIFLLLLFLVFYFAIKNLKLIQKNYFINRDRERYAGQGEDKEPDNYESHRLIIIDF